MDGIPQENIIISSSKKVDPEYKIKIEKSYNVCLEELSSPVENWEELLNDVKFTMNPETGSQSTHYTFVLNTNILCIIRIL